MFCQHRRVLVGLVELVSRTQPASCGWLISWFNGYCKNLKASNKVCCQREEYLLNNICWSTNEVKHFSRWNETKRWLKSSHTSDLFAMIRFSKQIWGGRDAGELLFKDLIIFQKTQTHFQMDLLSKELDLAFRYSDDCCFVFMLVLLSLFALVG